MLKLKQIKKQAVNVPFTLSDRLGYFKPDELYDSLLKIGNKAQLIFKNKHISFQNNLRMRVLKNEILSKKECSCNICGAKAEYGTIIKTLHGRFVVHLFTIKNGQEVFFNVDHIIPKSKNGKNTIDNLQITCSICNSEKADSLPKEIIIPQRTNVIVDEKVIKQTKPVSSLKIIGGYYFGKVC